MNVNDFKKLWHVSAVLMFAGIVASSVVQSDEHMSTGMKCGMDKSGRMKCGGSAKPSGGMKCGTEHMAMMKTRSFKVSKEKYHIPDVTLLDRTGKPVALKTLLDGSHPVAVNFIFTTCTTICPIMSATFVQMHKALGNDADRIQQISISIDPEHDSPKVLAAYAKRYKATSNWHFLTGKPKDIENVLRTFDVWTGTKTNHKPITLLRGKGETQWVRVNGLASGSELAKQARTILN